MAHIRPSEAIDGVFVVEPSLHGDQRRADVPDAPRSPVW